MMWMCRRGRKTTTDRQKEILFLRTKQINFVGNKTTKNKKQSRRKMKKQRVDLIRTDRSQRALAKAAPAGQLNLVRVFFSC